MVDHTWDGGSAREPPIGGHDHWRQVITLVGALLVCVAVANSGTTLVRGGLLRGVVLDLLLISWPGIVMLYVGVWLRESVVQPRFYPRIVAWTAAGLLVVTVVLSLHTLHPEVTIRFPFGTQSVMLGIGSLAGVGIGIHEARAFSHAEALEERNARLKSTERRLEEAVTELEESNERLEQFAYAASHDLQEPLRMVTSYLRLIEKRNGDALDEDGEEFLAFAVDGADRMREMIDGLLEYSRVDSQGDPFEPVDLDAVLDDALTDLQLRIEETDAEITRESLPTVEGDERQLQQLFQNLVSNAIDYSGDEPPRVHVSAERTASTWRIAVRDEGVGIDADDQERIFAVFERLHSIEESGGSGIGLALCRRIVERHDGEIGVDSEPGEGSTFSVELPAGG